MGNGPCSACSHNREKLFLKESKLKAANKTKWVPNEQNEENAIHTDYVNGKTRSEDEDQEYILANIETESLSSLSNEESKHSTMKDQKQIHDDNRMKTKSEATTTTTSTNMSTSTSDDYVRVNAESESLSKEEYENAASLNPFVSCKNLDNVKNLPHISTFKSTESWNDEEAVSGSEDLEISQIKEVIEALELQNEHKTDHKNERRHSLVTADGKYTAEDMEESEMMMVHEMKHLKECLDTESTKKDKIIMSSP